MSTTGLVAQRYGEQNIGELWRQLLASCSLAVVLALSLNLASAPIISLIAWLASPSQEVIMLASEYIQIRFLGAPAALLNLVMLGALLGMQNGKGPFYVVLCTNLLNIILDIWFVVGLDWGVTGAAWASVAAEYSACILATYLLYRALKKEGVECRLERPKLSQLLGLLSLNRDIFLRSLVLQACFSFMTFYGARLGDVILAANAVLLNFLLLLSFAMDGIAYALEAKVGMAVGRKRFCEVSTWVKVGFFWGSVLAIGYAVFFAYLGQDIIELLTSIEAVQQVALAFLPWIVLLPLVATSSFLLDGIFIGLTRAKDMRNTMWISGIVGFALPFWLAQSYGNHALWLAMSGFMAMRGITLGLRYRTMMRDIAFD
ncbi:DNA-damage-inducible protein F [Pseudoalteromonas luteoviolacea B = ATCC 29581]|nr:DNA-damage-inducible protein F [Pseudoalteromonas luteoviolacea B = ATCC 29581]